MYRSPGSSGVLQGVLSGPYTGGRRIVMASKLSRAARQRLADVLAGRAEPMPIVHERPPSLASRFPAIWALSLSLCALASLFALRFGDPRSEWAIHPASVAPAYAALAALAGVSVLSLFRRHARATGLSLAPGRYVLPLDVVEVAREDANGEQRIVVTPLGDARDVRIRGSEELVVVMADGQELRFALRSARDGDAALRRLEHAQRLLEDVSYGGDLEKAHTHDAFFDLRADKSWDSVAPDGPASLRTERTRARRAWLHGRLASAGVLALSAAAGIGVFEARNFTSDRALYLWAVRQGTPEALDAYLTRGRAYQLEAIALSVKLAEQRDDLAKRAREARKRAADASPQADWELTPEERATRRGTAEACIAALRARRSPAHPEATEIMESLVRRASSTGDARVPVRIDVRSVGRVPAEAATAERVTARVRATKTVEAFERVFSETCPASIVKLVPMQESSVIGRAPGMDIKVEVTWPASPTWRLPASPLLATQPEDGKLAVHAATYVFDVVLRGDGAREPASFRLSLPPPEKPTMTLRDRSLFVLEDPPVDARVHDVLSARAFDRLYDELWSLLFAGDPRVPLRDPPAAP